MLRMRAYLTRSQVDPPSRGLRRAYRAFLGAAALTTVGFVALIGRLNGGPTSLARIGIPSTVVGVSALVLSFVWLSRVRLRIAR